MALNPHWRVNRVKTDRGLAPHRHGINKHPCQASGGLSGALWGRKRITGFDDFGSFIVDKIPFMKSFNFGSNDHRIIQFFTQYLPDVRQPEGQVPLFLIIGLALKFATQY